MKHFILFVFFVCFVYNHISAQEWLLISQHNSTEYYLRLDCIPSSPRNETQFLVKYSKEEAERSRKQMQYATLPSYANTTLSFNSNFDSCATRYGETFDSNNQSFGKEFHGFLTYNTIEQGSGLEVLANWAYLLKEFGKNACIFASQTQYHNDSAQWIKFSEDVEMERYIRIDLSNQDSLAMYKIVYKPKTSKELQKELSLSEPPISVIFVYKIFNNGQKVLRFAESWFGKKNALFPVQAYPLIAEPMLVEDDITKLYVEWTLLLFEQGKDAIIQKSENLFGNNIKK